MLKQKDYLSQQGIVYKIMFFYKSDGSITYLIRSHNTTAVSNGAFVKTIR